MNLRTAFILLLISCSAEKSSVTNTFSDASQLGLIDELLPEASGIASSIANPGYIWSLNDGENPAEVYLIDSTAKVKLTCKLSVSNRDWEDIAVGPGPVPGKTYVYVGEIGDNKALFDTKFIYRFEEPVANDPVKQITLADTLRIQFSDGKRDSEAMMIDPLTNDFYIFSKREDSVRLYLVPQPYTKEIMIAQKLVTIPFKNIVAGGFSPDGLEILLKDYDHIYYWKRSAGEPLEKVLEGKPEELLYTREAQGESITWKRDGSGYYTLSETNPGKPSYLRFYKRN